MSELIFEKRRHVATLTLNCPERLNAITGTMLDALKEGVQAFVERRAPSLQGR